MSTRGLIVLLVVTVVAVLGAIVAAVLPTRSVGDAAAGGLMFPELARRVGDVDKVVVQTPQYTVAWEQRDGAWVSPEHGDYWPRKTSVPDLVLGLSRMTKVEAKTAQPDWYQYIRVGEPAATPPTGVAHVTVMSSDGTKLADTILGARSYAIPASHIRGGMFVREADGESSWLVEGVASVPAALSEWFDTILDVSGTEVSSISIRIGDKRVLEFNKTDASNGIYELVFKDSEVIAADSVANSNTLRSVASAIVGVRAEDVRAADRLTLGQGVRSTRFTTASGLELDITMVEQVDGPWALIKASAPEGSEAAELAAEINERTAKWAFKLADSHATRLTQPFENLVQKPTNPAADVMAPIPLDQDGRPILGPQGHSDPGLGITGGELIPGL